MSQPRLGVMISYLSGNEDSVNTFKSAVGKTIEEASCDGNYLTLKFTDGSSINFYDDGQSCCETRYMVCNDNLSEYKGSTLVTAELADAPNIQDRYGEEHEVQFLRVQTSSGVIVVSNHNEHNGYYGGFSIRVK